MAVRYGMKKPIPICFLPKTAKYIRLKGFDISPSAVHTVWTSITGSVGGYAWWADEQPSEEIKMYVEQQLKENEIDIVLSHTCPYKYEPTEVFLAGVDQSTVDASAEKWLDIIEDSTPYRAWFCGHWHINKRIDKMHFLFHGFESSDQFKENDNE